MNFCPYCGMGGGGSKVIESVDVCKEIADLYAKDQYKNIFDRAAAGDNVAKCYFVTYLRISSKNSTHSDNKLLEKIIELATQGEVFAIASRGIRLFYNGQKDFLGVENDGLINEGVNLIKQAANAGEAAAMTFVAEWMFNGSYAEKNISAAYAMMKSAADIGYAPAMYKLSEWHRNGINGISKNEELANDLREKAAFWGDQDAMRYFKDNNTEWFKTDLEYAISSDSIKNIKRLVSSNETYDLHHKELPYQTEYEKCCKKEEYVTLYKRIRDEVNKDKSTKQVFNLLELLVTKITGFSLKGTTFEQAEENAKSAEETAIKINNLIEQYTCPQHYLHFKEDLTRINVDVDKESLPGLLEIISKHLLEKCQKEVKSYENYKKVKADAETAKGSGCIFIVLLIIAVVVGVFFLPAGVVIGILAIIGELASIGSKNAYKKISPKIKNDYLLINSLIGYGYKPIDPKFMEVKFDSKESPYINNIPSVLDEDASSKEDSIKADIYDTNETSTPKTAENDITIEETEKNQISESLTIDSNCVDKNVLASLNKNDHKRRF